MVNRLGRIGDEETRDLSMSISLSLCLSASLSLCRLPEFRYRRYDEFSCLHTRLYSSIKSPHALTVAAATMGVSLPTVERYRTKR